MHGGLGHRKFYLDEVDRIELKHKNNLPESRLSNHEVQAGFQRLYDTYGSSLTLINLEEKTHLREEELLTWTVRKFNFRVEIYAWQAEVSRKYSEIKTPKKKGR